MLLATSCIEEFVPQTVTFEDLLVVEATITDEFKFHEIELSRTFRFEEEPTIESQANVRIIDNTENVYTFIEKEPGKYVSMVKFNAESNKNYTLHITTSDNATYSSSPVKLPSTSAQVTDVSYIKNTNSDGEEGIDIFVDSFDPLGNSKYYRYEFEETYRIIPPFWSPFEIVVISDVPPFKVSTQPREQEERVCYNTMTNKNIIQTQTNNLFEDRVTKFPIKFISKTNSIIRDRYSILVKQHVQSLEAYTYFRILNEFSNSESVFSENQPGFLDGNIFSDDNSSEKVLGFFEITSLKSKRIFLNFKDAFPNENRPIFFVECPAEFETPFLIDPNNSNSSPLIDKIKNGEIEHFEDNTDFFGNLIENEPYFVTNRECGDCTVFGTNIKPDFWVD